MTDLVNQATKHKALEKSYYTVGKMFAYSKKTFCQQPIEFGARAKTNLQSSRTKLVNLLTVDGFINK